MFTDIPNQTKLIKLNKKTRMINKIELRIQNQNQNNKKISNQLLMIK